MNGCSTRHYYNPSQALVKIKRICIKAAATYSNKTLPNNALNINLQFTQLISLLSQLHYHFFHFLTTHYHYIKGSARRTDPIREH